MTKQNNKAAANPNAGTPAAANTKAENTGTADGNLTSTAAAGKADTPNAGPTGAGAKNKKVKALQVVAKVENFRRGGRVFSRTETTVALDELTAEQIKQIKDEPLLAVSEVEVDAE